MQEPGCVEHTCMIVTRFACFFKRLQAFLYSSDNCCIDDVSSVERQKGINAVQRCSIENHNGAFSVHSDSLW